MTRNELQDLATAFGVLVSTENYRFMRLAVKVVGDKESTDTFLKAIQERLPISVALYSTTSRFELLAEIKYQFMKLKARLRKKDLISTNCIHPKENLKPGVYVKYTD